jgi:hypothetical protein
VLLAVEFDNNAHSPWEQHQEVHPLPEQARLPAELCGRIRVECRYT